LKTFNRTIGPEVVIDTGIVVEYLEGSPAGKKIKEIVFGNEFVVSILATPVLAIEVYYLLRRKSSKNFAVTMIQKLEDILTFVPLNGYLIHCGEIKALTAFALSDCYTLGLAEYMNLKALFKREKEIENQLQKVGSNQYTQRIVFIDDFQLFKDKAP
jgi:predicted nucleic acid-binding protein